MNDQNLNPLLRITLEAAQMEGGEISVVVGRERLPNVGEVIRENISAPRCCIRLEEGGIAGRFDVERVPRSVQGIFRIRGMWDMYRDLPAEMAHSDSLMDTTALFDVSLNDQCVYHGRIAYMNSRRWRFWPTIDLPFPSALLRLGSNHFAIRNLTPPFRALKPMGKLSRYLRNTAYQVSDVQIILLRKNIPSAPVLPEGVFIGHLVGGHDAVHLENDDLSRSIERFCLGQQGNLIALLMKPRKASYDLDLDLVNASAIAQKGLKVVLRYYGDNQGATIPEDEYARKVRDFAARLGGNFLGFAPHEEHQAMARIIEENRFDSDISVFSRRYIDQFSRRVSRIREIRADVPIWDTDPSLYSHFHLRGGADVPAIEHGLRGASLDVASARGTAKAFGKSAWAAINSFECQAWGGLGILDQEIDDTARFERRRGDLWWLTQHLLYLGGARIIYSESGIFEHRVTIQREFDDPHLQDLRGGQADLIEFAKKHRLRGQPLSEIAYLQGKYDIFKGTFFTSPLLDAMGSSLYSWKNLEVCFPSLRREIPGVENLETYLAEGRSLISALPYGNVDILPAIPGSANWNEYAAIIASGWHTMDRAIFKKLEEFVCAGGTFIVLLPQLTTGTSKDCPCDQLDPNWLARVAGIQMADAENSEISLGELSLADEAGEMKFPEFSTVLKALRERGNAASVPVKNLALIGNHTVPIVGDQRSGTPFLIRNRIGRGSIYLFNIADFPSEETAYFLFNAATKDILDALPLRVRLHKNAPVSFTLYPRDIERNEYRLFVVNAAWHEQRNLVSAEFEFLGRFFRLDVPRRKVIAVDLSPRQIEVIES